jgi:hypothetical protein
MYCLLIIWILIPSKLLVLQFLINWNKHSLKKKYIDTGKVDTGCRPPKDKKLQKLQERDHVSKHYMCVMCMYN